jgi:hypothetical protein
MLWKMLILVTIEMNRSRKSKWIISRNDNRRRKRTIKLQRRNGREDDLMRNLMPLEAVQSLIVSLISLSCNLNMLRSIWGSFSHFKINSY